MACYSPLRGYRSKNLNPTGKRSIVFSPRDGFADMPVEVPCGQCIGCRLERSRQWAIRCVHEASMYEDNCFITLTYNDENLPKDGSLNKKHFQDFMKRLRETTGAKIRYYHCGEYGENLGRPHYHACLFNYDFPDKIAHTQTAAGLLYTSELLAKTWGKGFVTIGNVTFESAAYVSRYITKKILGKKAAEHYNGLQPEYTTMSRRPGIGKPWLEKYLTDVYPSDQVVLRAKIMKPPKFYDNQLDKENPTLLARLKSTRKRKGEANEDNTCERLRVREKIQNINLKQNLKRKYENDL